MTPTESRNRSSEPAPQGAGNHPKGLRAYLAGRLPGWERVVVGLVGLAFLPVMFVPILPLWKITLIAPQYREGLRMFIFVHDLRGDLDRINILNHYIGMREIDAATFPEFGFMPWAISLFGLVALSAAIWGRRWLAYLGWIGFAAFGAVMMLRFNAWMVDFGTNLDPKAALDFGAFTPPLLGTAVRGNFVITSIPHIGGVILLGSGLLGPVLLLAEWLRARRRKRTGATAFILLIGLLTAGAAPVLADEMISYAEPPERSPLQDRIDAACPGTVLRIPAGVYPGQVIVDRRVTLIGEEGTILDGGGRGSVLVIQAPGTQVRGLTLRNSGWELLFDDAGVLIEEAAGVILENLVLEDTNHGVYVRNALGPTIRDCRFAGRRGRVHEENHGNAIHVWYAKDARIRDNVISGHRDGIYLSFAETAHVTGNVAYEVDRFGLHSMYSQRNIIEGNTFTRNTAGVALMFSNRMEMTRNLFAHNRGHRTYGLLLRDCSDSEFTGNRLIDNTIGLFLDGSNRNRFHENLFAENGWGVIAYSSSEENAFTRNNFMENDYQVSLDMRRTRNRLHVDGVGNYWSDARAYDLDGDGLGDAPHSPVGLFAFVSKQYPDLTVFAGSPAVVALDLAQRSLPALHQTVLLDPAPLLTPVSLPTLAVPALPGPADADRSTPLLVSAAAATLGGVALFGLGRAA